MIPKFYFYDAKTYEFIDSINSDNIVDFDFNVTSINCEGYVNIKLTDDNSVFLKEQVFENSHFVKFGVSELYPGIVENVVMDELDNNVIQINFCGFKDYIEKVDAVPFFLGGNDESFFPEDNNSYMINLYGRTPFDVLWELFDNNVRTMNSRGFDSSIFQFEDLHPRNNDSDNGATNKSFRINVMETPSLGSVFSDVLSDYNMNLLIVKTSQVMTDKFNFSINKLSTISSYSLPVSTVGELSFDGENMKRRSFSSVSGTDFLENKTIVRLPYDSSVAYSTLISDSSQQRTDYINDEALSNISTEQNNLGTIKFTLHSDDYEVLSELSFSDIPYKGLILDKNIASDKVVYNLQRGALFSINQKLKKASSGIVNVIRNDVNKTSKLSKKNNKRKPSDTGWRW